MAEINENINFNVNFNEDSIDESASSLDRIDELMEKIEKSADNLRAKKFINVKDIKDSEAAMDALRKHAELVRNTISEMQKSGSAKLFEPDIESLSRGLDGVKNVMRKIIEANPVSIKVNTNEIGGQYKAGVSAAQALAEVERYLSREQRERIARTEQEIAAQRRKEAEARRELETQRQVTAEREKTKSALASQVGELSGEVSELENTYKGIFSSGNWSGLREANEKLTELKAKAEELKRKLSEAKAQGIDTSGLESQLAGVESQMSGLADTASKGIKTKLTSSFSKVFNSATNIAKTSFKKMFDTAGRLTKSWLNTMKKGFLSVVSVMKNALSGLSHIGGSGFLSGKAGSLMGIASLAGLVALGKEAVGLSSDLVKVQNVIDNVFTESTETINDFTDSAISKFGLVEVEAKNMIGTFGGLLSASNITGKVQTEMSKNLTALAGDLASFNNMSSETVFKKLQSGLTGSATALRSLGINMTTANLESFRLSQGIKTAYKDMSQAEKITLRYNYILNQTATAQGDYAKNFGTWSNQVRLLSNNFKQLLAILGGGIIKALYPSLVLLNQIVSAAVNAANALAKLFGFEAMDLSNMFGGGGEIPDLDSYTEGLSDAADATKDIADATDEVSEATKNANDNLQTFDKLNNIKSQDKTSKATSSADVKLPSVNTGDLMKFDSYYERIVEPDKKLNEKLEKLKDWLNTLFKLLSDKKWKDAGKHIADGVNSLVSKLRGILQDKKLYNSIDAFNDALTDFYDGLLDIDFENIGGLFGDGVNLIAYYINSLYDKMNDKDLLKRTGRKISDFFYGLVDTVDWNGAGKAIGTPVRALMDIIRGFFDGAEARDLAAKSGEAFKQLILGIFNRVFDNGGAEEIGRNIASSLNFVFRFISTALGDGNASSKLREGVVRVINTAIHSISQEDLSGAFSGLLTLIGDLFGIVADIDAESLSKKVSEAINRIAEDGILSGVTKNITKAFMNIAKLIVSIIKDIDWLEVGGAILDGIGEAISEDPDGAKALATVLITLFTVNLVGKLAGVTFNALGTAIFDSIIGGMSVAGAAAAAPIAGIIASVVGSAAVGKLAYDYTKQKQTDLDEISDAWKRSEEVVKRMLSNQEQLLNSDGWVDYKMKLINVNDAYKGLDKNVRKWIESNENQLITVGQAREAAREYAQTLRDNGHANEDEIRRLEELANARSIAGDELKTYIRVMMRDLHEQYSTESATLNSMTQDELDAFDGMLKHRAHGFGEEFMKSAEQGFTNSMWLIDEANNKLYNRITGKLVDIPDEFDRTGYDSIVGYVSGMEDGDDKLVTATGKFIDKATGTILSKVPDEWRKTAVSSIDNMALVFNKDGSVKGASKKLVDDAIKVSSETAKSESPKIGSDITDGISRKINSDTGVKDGTSNAVSGAISLAQKMAQLLAPSVGKSITDGVGNEIKSNSGIKTATSGIISVALSGADTLAKTLAPTVGGNLITSISNKIRSNSGLKTSTNSVVSDAINGAANTAHSGATKVGEYLGSGIENGVERKRGTILTKVKNICDTILGTFRSIMDIHSPSEAFAKLAEFIPLGIAKGIDDTADDAYSAVSEMSRKMFDGLDTSTYDLSSIVDASKFSDKYRDILSQTDAFNKELKSKYGDLTPLEMQSDMITSPTVKQRELSANVEQSSLTKLADGFAALINRFSGVSGINSSRNIDVNLNMDGNMMASFIIDTVRGEAVQTGNF